MRQVMKAIFVLALTTVTFAAGTAVAAPYMGAGRFMTVTPQDPVEGLVKILPGANGTHVLILDDDFKASRGPDLHLVLHKEVLPRSYDPSNSVILGPLQAFQGRQMYVIPAGVDPAQYKAVIVWCRKFGVTFGSAALVPATAFR